MSDEQDIRRMGGIWRKIPFTYAAMWIGSLALAGIPLFAGYYSKDAILEAAYARGSGVAVYAFLCGILAAFLTAFYSWRLLILTFHGAPRADRHVMDHVHESPLSMLVPLGLLSLGAILTGLAFHEEFVGHDWRGFWQGAIVNAPGNDIIDAMHHVPGWVPLAPTVVGLLGIGLAYAMYVLRPDLPGLLVARFPGVHSFLIHRWYFDELYAFLFVRPAVRLARALWQVGDAKLIDGIPNGVASLAAGGSGQVVRIQNGSIAVYAFSMLIGLVLLVSVFLLFR